MQLVLSAPALYALELTPVCNNRCPGCFNVFVEDKATRAMPRAPRALSAAEWRVILEKIQPHATRLKLSGGEPTLHPEFEEIVRTIDALGISFTVFTNARWKHPDQLIGSLKNVSQFGGFLISLHGSTPEMHEAFSGINGSFQETIENIRLAVNAGLNAATSTVITRQNCQSIESIIDLSAKLGADHAVVNRYLGQPLPDVEPTDAELKATVQKVDQLRAAGARVKFGNCVPQCFVDNSSTGCLAGVAYCTISPWGEMRPCSHSSRVVGNLLTESVEAAWRSETMEAWRGLMPASCESSCAAYSACHGACRALIEIRDERRDPLRGDPLPLYSKPPQHITLYEALRPIGSYHLRQEEFGMVLLRGNRIVPVASEDMPILSACDGAHTLRDIQQHFGARGLRVIVGLHQKGLIELADARSSKSA